jgi:hypothetical protein
MRTRAGNWFLLVGLSGWACTPSTPRQPPAPAVRDAGPALPSFVPPTTDGAVAVTDAARASADASEDAGNACRPRGPENTPAACGNQLDDDCDTQVDCADHDCANTPQCRSAGVPPAPPPTSECAPRGPENTPAACGNHLDDDCDGQSDCRDQDCLNVRGAGCDSDASAPRPPTSNCIRRGPENTNEACGNHLDDDCDGYSDCADQDCAPPAVTVCPQRPPAPVPVRPAAPAAARPAVAPVARPVARPAAPAARP